MKMDKLDFDALRSAIHANPLNATMAKYEQLGRTAKQYRWDCLYAVPYEQRAKLFSDFYRYLNDDHIDTALRAIIK